MYMQRLWFTIILILTINLAGVSVDCSVSTPEMFRQNVLSMQKAPKVYECNDVKILRDKDAFYRSILNTPELRIKDKDNTVKVLYYESVPYQGKPTRVFAYLGMPKVAEGQKVPAMVLVHGGGGTAFESWVRLWNSRGYAAIAMDTCGCIPVGTYGNWQRTEFGGPAGWGGMGQEDQPMTDQWTYHAVSSVILAHSLLRSQKQVDSRRIGITGISWGGYLTCITAGLDKRFKFAVPVYGCGFLGDNSAWLPGFESMGKERADMWLRQWDPSVYLPDAKMPFLWITGSNDFAYPMDSLQKSYRLPKGSRTLCIKTDMQHGHGGMGENPEEIHAFADSFCMKGIPLAKIGEQGQDGNEMWVKFSSKSAIKSAVLNYTRDSGAWQERKWESVSAVIKGKKATATIPEGVKVCYFNLTDERGLVTSAEHVEL